MTSLNNRNVPEKSEDREYTKWNHFNQTAKMINFIKFEA